MSSLRLSPLLVASDMLNRVISTSINPFIRMNHHQPGRCLDEDPMPLFQGMEYMSRVTDGAVGEFIEKPKHGIFTSLGQY